MTPADESRPDAEVIQASLTDPHAFGQIFDRHVDAVHGFLVRRGGRDLAEDLAGEVFRVAFEMRHRFDLERSSARPWLYGIATNVVRRHRRTAGRRSAAYRRLALRELAGGSDHLDQVDAAMDARRRAGELDDALAGLATRDRDALLLHVWEELSYAEVAEALGIPVGTVRSRLNRARRRLRAALTTPSPGTSRPTAGFLGHP